MKQSYTARIAGAEEFAASRDAWNALAGRMHYPTPFATWEWIYTWWEQFGRDALALPIFVHHGARLCAILPVFRTTVTETMWMKAIALDYAGGEDLFSDHLDIICAPVDTEASSLAVLAFLADEYRGWDVLRIPNIAEDGGLRKVFWRYGQGLAIEWRTRSIAPYVALPQTFDDFMAQLPRKDRHTVRSQHRRATEEGAQYVKFEGASMDEGLNHLFGLHEKRASQKGVDSTFAREQTKQFHFALVRRLADGQLMLRGLKNASGEIIACLYAFQMSKRIFFYQLGYDPNHSRLSPGVAVITESIREAIDRGCSEYNFLQGDEPYKRNWARRSRRLLQFRLYNRTAAGHRLYASAKARYAIKNAARRWLPQWLGGAALIQYWEQV